MTYIVGLPWSKLELRLGFGLGFRLGLGLNLGLDLGLLLKGRVYIVLGLDFYLFYKVSLKLLSFHSKFVCSSNI